ncbi:TetR/AcrR family transcriptional regulator [Actinokineospora sp.]|uniref:TetR/AcrR family transcriptional regulator n=1 Tax=Actinokineospora sp. TaxID=1872133 RepID=UPI003D6A04D2
MSEITDGRRRRRRTDADRSAASILRAALEVLGTDPNAGVEDVAMAAGVSRQTVYAHFKNRDALVSAAIDAVTADAVSEMDTAELDEGPAGAALLRLLDASWRTIHRYPLLLAAATESVGAAADDTRHNAVLDHLSRVLDRGQESGEFTRDQPIGWLATAVVTLGHAAGAAVAAGRMTLPEAVDALAASSLRVCGVDRPAER